MDVSVVSAFLALLLILLWFLYKHLSKPYNYWKELGVPSVPGYPVFGSSLTLFLRKPIHDAFLEVYNKYGRVHGLYQAGKPALSVGDPDLVRDMLVKDFQVFVDRQNFFRGNKFTDKMLGFVGGDEWKRIRTIVSPTFTTGRIKKTSSMILDCVKTLEENMKRIADEGKDFDVKRLFGTFSMDVIVRTSFATKIDSHNDPENAFVAAASKVFGGGVGATLRVFFFVVMPRLSKLLGIELFPKSSMDFFQEATMRIMNERQKSGQIHNDFLQLLTESSEDNLKEKLSEHGHGGDDGFEEQNGSEHSEKTKRVFKTAEGYRGLTFEEIVAQCMNFFIAGYDTSASTLTFTAYLLALNPECQEKLIEEVDDVLYANKNELNYEAVQGMVYLDKVVSESLRMYPPAVGLSRVANEDYSLGNTGIIVKKGMPVNIPVHAMHYDPEFFPEPEKFDPERFSAEEKAKRHPYTYLPFGAGPRMCVGMRFALTEVKFCLAYLLSRFRFKTCPQTKVPLEFHKALGLMQAKNVTLRVEKRKDGTLCDQRH